MERFKKSSFQLGTILEHISEIFAPLIFRKISEIFKERRAKIGWQEQGSLKKPKNILSVDMICSGKAL